MSNPLFPSQPTPASPAPARLLDAAALTEGQERVWRKMLELQEVNGGKPPTQGEISRALGYKSVQGCTTHFPALAKLGFVICSKWGTWRSWVAVEQPVEGTPVTEYRRYPNNKGRRGRPSIRLAQPLPDLPALSDLTQGPRLCDGYTERQIEVWKTVLRLQVAAGNKPPTQHDVSKALGMSSVQGARAHYARLAEGGYMKHKHRTWYAVLPPAAPSSDAAASPTTGPATSPAVPDEVF